MFFVSFVVKKSQDFFAALKNSATCFFALCQYQVKDEKQMNGNEEQPETQTENQKENRTMRKEIRNFTTTMFTLLALIIVTMAVSAQSIYVKKTDVRITDTVRVGTGTGTGAAAGPASDHIYGYIRWKKSQGFPAVKQPIDFKNTRFINVRASNPCGRFTVLATVHRQNGTSFGGDVKVGETTATSFKETADGYECFYDLQGMPGGESVRVSAFLNNQLWMPGTDPLSADPSYEKSLQVIGGTNFVTLRRTRPDFPASAQLSFQMALTPKQIVR